MEKNMHAYGFYPTGWLDNVVKGRISIFPSVVSNSFFELSSKIRMWGLNMSLEFNVDYSIFDQYWYSEVKFYGNRVLTYSFLGTLTLVLID